jgi:sporulation protein YlmC with PRC-barrel domain
MRRLALLFAAAAFLVEAGADNLYSDLHDPGLLAVESVIGMEVVTPGGEHLGTIRQVLFDRVTGKVEAIALDRDGVTYPAASLFSADIPGRVIAERLEAASAGATAQSLAPARGLSNASGLIDLREGHVRPPQ